VSALEHTLIEPVTLRISDERLAARVSTDPTAFTELYERYAQPLLRFTRSLLRDPHDAADAAQDAWTRAFSALRAEPLRVLSVRSWLFAIARNACIDRLRDDKRCIPADIDERALGSSPAAEDVIELRDRAREALNDLAGLSERQRRAVVLRELNGLDGEDLARALHTDTRRASWLLTDARRSLAEARSGRGLSCEAARHALETSRVRNRAVRAHLAGCSACDGYARRRVASRVHLHGIALFLLALPARLRALFTDGLGAARPVGAVAAAALVAGAPAVHVLHHHPGAQRALHAASSPAPHRASALAAVRATAAPGRRKAPARAEAVIVRVSKPAHATSRTATRPDPRWAPVAAPAPESSVPQVVAPAPPVQLPAPVRRLTQRVTVAVAAVVPAAAPVSAVADDVLAKISG
jgi:RNA polymerase sigma-70 factor, ECF subfamily